MHERAEPPVPSPPFSPPPILVIGHKNPDTDAICSAIGYAEFLRANGRDAVAACCGGMNARTDWVLRRAGVEPPRLVMDVRPTAGSICRREVISAHPDETFLNVYQRMKAVGVRSIPLVDDDGRVVGVPGERDLLELLMHSVEASGRDDALEARRVRTSLANIKAALRAPAPDIPGIADDQDFLLMVAASSDEMFAARLPTYDSRQLLVVVGDRPEIHRLSVEHPVRALVITGGARLDPETRAIAAAKGLAVIEYPGDTASAVQLIRCSPRVGAAPGGPFLSVPAKSLVSHLIQEIQESTQVLFPVVSDVEGHLLGVFSKSDLLDPPRVPLVLVDHNEFSQAVTGADEADILEVIDHHRLGGNLQSREPIRFINEPVGSTSTIVARGFRQAGLRPEKGTALCLCAGLISDTLNLTSPTTTTTDRETLTWLADTAGIDLDGFAAEFFAAGSMLRSAEAPRIIGMDRKEYEEHGWRVSISQVEEVALDGFDERRAGLAEALDELRRERGLDHASLLVTDITRLFSLLLVAGDPRICECIDYPKEGNGVFRLEGVVSRKKQFFPYLSRVLAKARRMPPKPAPQTEELVS